ncbi:AI-2E family transporter [Methylocystis sp. JAN1]|uniref:AI-2E family transporter n=1 Tax=Methylocystis sp. JAN1 TaxID=3397211 RepID=UPI003FA3300F
MHDGRILEVTSVIVTILLVLTAFKFAQAVVEPLVFALFIIEIAWPMQKALQMKIGKGMALAVTLLVTAAVALTLFSVIVWGGRQIVDWVTDNVERIQDLLIASTAWLEKHDIFILALISDHFNPAALVRMVHAVAMRVNTILAFAVIVLIYVILGLGETDIMTARVAALKNQDASRRLIVAGRRIGEKFRTYMLVRTAASVATGLAVWGFARFMRLDMSGAFGVLAFALNYLPYIGSFIVTAFLPLFAFVQFGSFETPLLVLIGISFIQALIGSYLEPVFSGSALSISPPLVLFSIILWTYLWGALGAFLGVPLALAALTLFEEFPATQWMADVLSGGRATRS